MTNGSLPITGDGSVYGPTIQQRESWRKGDEGTDVAVDPATGKDVPAETEKWYKGINKPADFQSWPMEKRAGWRTGIDATIAAYAGMTVDALALRVLSEIVDNM